jgi:hypothetical protein
MKLFNGEHLSLIDKLESEVEDYFVSNWGQIFPHLTLIDRQVYSEILKRPEKKKAGIIDILAFNPGKKRFVVVEIKTTKLDGKVIDQGLDYSQSIKNAKLDFYQEINQNYPGLLPDISKISFDAVETIFIVQDSDVNKIKDRIGRFSQDLVIAVLSYSFYKNHLSKKTLVFDFFSNHHSEFEELLNPYPQNHSNPKELKSNQLSFPKIESRKIRTHYSFDGYLLYLRFRRFYFIPLFFKEVIGFELNELKRLDEPIEFKEEGFILCRSSESSYYLFVGEDLLDGSNMELRDKFDFFEAQYPTYCRY